MDVNLRGSRNWLLAITTLMLLHGCGGNDNNALVPNSATSAKPSASPRSNTVAALNDNPDAKTGKSEAAEPTQRIPLTELLTEVALPALPSNDRPDLSVGDAASISQLQSELYSIQWSNLDGDQSAPDCPKGSVLKCPSFSRYQLSRDGRILARTWAYLALSKKWVEIKSFSHAFDQVFDPAQVAGDGTAWQEDVPWVSQWAWRMNKDEMLYHLGKTQIKLYGIQTSIAQTQPVDLLEFKPKPDQKVVQFRMAVIQGEYLSLRPYAFQPLSLEKPPQPMGFSFLGMAKFRRALSKGDGFCMEMNGVAQLLQFEPLALGAKAYDKADVCKTPLEAVPLNPKSNMTTLEEGVKTIFDRQVIYLSQMTRPRTGELSSKSQYYWAFSTDSKNNPIYGKSYQQGFIQSVPQLFYDASFVQDWLAANSNYQQRELPR